MLISLSRKLSPLVRILEIFVFLALSAQMASAAAKVKLIDVTGNLSFGTVQVGSSAQSLITISNAGSTTLSVSGITLPAGFSTTFTTASLRASQITTTLIKFSPTAAITYTGVVTVNASGAKGTNTLAASGKGVGQTIALGGNLNFGNVAVSSNAQRTLTITNTGTTNLTVTNITVPKGFSGTFSGMLASNTFTNVTITFSPTGASNYTGTITVTSDALGGSNKIAVTGTGTKPGGTIVVSGNLSFGNVPVNTTATKTLTISNSSTVTLTVSNITYPAGFSGSFSGNITAHASKNVTVTFSPTVVTNYGGTVTVNSSATNGTDTVAASGTGTGAVIVLSGNLTFGNVPVNTSAHSILVVSNAGNVTMTVSSITYPGGFTGSFSGSIAGGTTTNVTVTFSPTSATNYSGSAAVKSSAVGGVNTIAVSGTGTGPRIALSGNLAFGNVPMNSSVQSTLVISNIGTATLNVSSVTYPSGFSGSFSGAIAVGTSTNVTVTFSPTATTKYSGTVTVSSDALGGTNTIAASGTGTSPQIILRGNLNFSNVPVNTSVQQTLIISNGSASTLNVSNIIYPAGFSGGFSNAIAPGTASNVMVTFMPTDTIAYGGTVTVISDAVGDTNTIAASGEGIAPVISLSGDLNFPGVIVGQSSQMTLTITNSGGVTLNVSSITCPTGFSGSFSGAIAPGATTNVNVTFTPTNSVHFGGTITVNSDAFKGVNTVNASGTGIAATRIISLIGPLDFGNIFVSSTAHLTLTISNSGNSDLTYTNITVPAQYAVNITSGILAPGVSTNVDVAFTPPNTNSYNGVLTVDSDATGGINTTNVTGTGTNVANPIINLSGDLNFADTMVGSVIHGGLTISNSGNATLDVSNIVCPPGFNSTYQGAIAPGTAANAQINFAPVAAQDYSGLLTVVSDATFGANTWMASGDAFSYAPANTTYNGLFYPSNNVTFTNSGYFSARTGTKNTLSGKIRLAGKQYSVSGTISGTGSFHGIIVRRGLSNLTVVLQAGFDGGDVMKGAISDGILPGSFGADVMANRSVFNRTNAAPQAGIYTITVAGTNSPALTNGPGTITIATTGGVKVTATLGDGSRVTQTTTVGQNGQIPFFASLYSNKGSILGWLTITNTPGDQLNGTVDWFKPAGINTNTPDGFSLSTSLTGVKH